MLPFFKLSEGLLEDNDAKEMSLLDVVKMNRNEWPQIVIGCIGSFISGGAMPVFAVLFGEIIAVNFSTFQYKQKK